MRHDESQCVTELMRYHCNFITTEIRVVIMLILWVFSLSNLLFDGKIELLKPSGRAERAIDTLTHHPKPTEAAGGSIGDCGVE